MEGTARDLQAGQTTDWMWVAVSVLLSIGVVVGTVAAAGAVAATDDDQGTIDPIEEVNETVENGTDELEQDGSEDREGSEPNESVTGDSTEPEDNDNETDAPSADVEGSDAEGSAENETETEDADDTRNESGGSEPLDPVENDSTDHDASPGEQDRLADDDSSGNRTDGLGEDEGVANDTADAGAGLLDDDGSDERDSDENVTETDGEAESPAQETDSEETDTSDGSIPTEDLAEDEQADDLVENVTDAVDSNGLADNETEDATSTESDTIASNDQRLEDNATGEELTNQTVVEEAASAVGEEGDEVANGSAELTEAVRSDDNDTTALAGDDALGDASDGETTAIETIDLDGAHDRLDDSVDLDETAEQDVDAEALADVESTDGIPDTEDGVTDVVTNSTEQTNLIDDSADRVLNAADESIPEGASTDETDLLTEQGVDGSTATVEDAADELDDNTSVLEQTVDEIDSSTTTTLDEATEEDSYVLDQPPGDLASDLTGAVADLTDTDLHESDTVATITEALLDEPASVTATIDGSEHVRATADGLDGALAAALDLASEAATVESGLPPLEDDAMTGLHPGSGPIDDPIVASDQPGQVHELEPGVVTSEVLADDHRAPTERRDRLSPRTASDGIPNEAAPSLAEASSDESPGGRDTAERSGPVLGPIRSRQLGPLAAISGAVLMGSAAGYAFGTKAGISTGGSLFHQLWVVLRSWATHVRMLRWFPALPGYSRHDSSDPLEHEVRASIHATVESRPGVHPSALSEDLDVPRSTIRYHLRILEYERMIESENVRGRRCVFPIGDPRDECSVIESGSTAHDVLQAIDDLEPVRVSVLATELNRDVSTISYHLDRLDESGLVIRDEDGPAVYNRLSPAAAASLGPRRSSGPEPQGGRSD